MYLAARARGGRRPCFEGTAAQRRGVLCTRTCTYVIVARRGVGWFSCDVFATRLFRALDTLPCGRGEGGGRGWCGGLGAGREEWLEARTEGTCVAVPCGVTSTLLSVLCMY